MAWGGRSKKQVQASEGAWNTTGNRGFGWLPFKPRWNNTDAQPLEFASRASLDQDYRPPESLIGSFVLNKRQIEGTAQGRMMMVRQGIGLLPVGGYSLGPAGMLSGAPLSDTESPPLGMPLIGAPYLGEFVIK